MSDCIDITCIKDMKRYAQDFAQYCPDNAWVYLIGDLGTGKTTFTQSFIRAKGYSGHITSPTYAIMHSYLTRHGEVVHADLYRLSEPEELYEIGLLEVAPPTIKLIEWPEKGEGVLPNADITLQFNLQIDTELKRFIKISKNA